MKLSTSMLSPARFCRVVRVSLAGIVLAAGALGVASAADIASWRHAEFKDFAAGTLGNAGQNLYVAKDGTIRSIRRFDLNQDGYIDLVYNSTHDWVHNLPASLAKLDSKKGIQQTQVALNGSGKVVVRDLDGDGYSDFVVLPSRANMRAPRNYVTIGWGGADGWPPSRVNRSLPTHKATAVAAADIDSDGFVDIVALNGKRWEPDQPPGKVLRIYWGGRDGYNLRQFLDVGAGAAIDVASGDFDGDGREDLGMIEPDGTVRVYWNTLDARSKKSIDTTHHRAPIANSVGKAVTLGVAPGGKGQGDRIIVGTDKDQLHVHAFSIGRVSSARSMPGARGAHLSVGDLDGDGQVDLVFTHLELGETAGGEAAGVARDAHSTITVLWGTGQSFERSDGVPIMVPLAVGTAIGDFNADGRPDLAVAVHQGPTTMEGHSQILLGQGKRRFERSPGYVVTSGAMNPVVVPAEHGYSDRVLFNNTLKGTLNEDVPLDVFWGGADGFSAERHWELPFRSGYKALAADLRSNGHVDLIVLNSRHGSVGPYHPDDEHEATVGAHIYWGANDGKTPGPNRFDLERRTILQEPYIAASNVADLNKDGYLDLVLGQFENDAGDDAEMVIYYGTAQGFNAEHSARLKNPARTAGTAIGDVNNDGWLDIVLIAYQAHQVTILHGGSQGFSTARSETFSFPSAIELELADVNDDGWLDLLLSSFDDPVSGDRDLGFAILLGGPQGYQPGKAQWLPGWTPIGLAVADIDADGYLDIVSPNYHAALSREDIPSYIYWGSANGYSIESRTALMINSAHDVVISDFDGDGKLDLAFSSHSSNYSHRLESPVFYNDGNRFRDPRVQRLPTHGSHFIYSQDIGNIADRSLEEHYDSTVLSWQRAAKQARIEARGEMPQGASFRLEVRSAPNAAALVQADWRAVVDGQPFDVNRADRVLQYRVNFVSPNGDRYPVLQSVDVRVSN